MTRTGGNQRDRVEEESEQPHVRKKMKKVLGGNGKGITFAVRFREEKDKGFGRKFYDIMSTKER